LSDDAGLGSTAQKFVEDFGETDSAIVVLAHGHQVGTPITAVELEHAGLASQLVFGELHHR
jgi:hypothetical protein